MKDIFQRFMFLFHWAGFICLALLILVGVLDIVLDSGNYLGDLLYILEFNTRYAGILEILWVWLAVTHYPIKWILTGNKSFFPWKD
tara:strand:- start:1166 stop:1423 length:258 start_codon:yes stop_codon:yes gene_type:complete